MAQSPEIGKLAEALCKAQGRIHGAAKDSKNPFFKSSYASLESIIDCSRGPLVENGLCVIQMIDGDALVTTLAHSSGQWISGSYPIKPVKADPQAVGSAITYARRYALTAAIGIVQTDDDGQAASQPVPRGNVMTPTERPKQADYPKVNPGWQEEPATQAQIAKFMHLRQERGMATIEMPSKITKGQVTRWISELEAIHVQ